MLVAGYTLLVVALSAGAFALGWRWQRRLGRELLNERLAKSADALEAANRAIRAANHSSREWHATALQMREGVMYWHGRYREVSGQLIARSEKREAGSGRVSSAEISTAAEAGGTLV